MLRSNSKSLGNYVVSPEEEKGRLQCSGKDLQKRKVLSMDDDDDCSKTATKRQIPIRCNGQITDDDTRRVRTSLEK